MRQGVLRFLHGSSSNRPLQHFDDNLAMVLAVAPEAVTTTGSPEKVKTYYVLALVGQERKVGKKGVFLILFSASKLL
jgi:hypothetical protein